MRQSTQIFLIAIALIVFGIGIHSLIPREYYNPFNFYTNLYACFCVLLVFLSVGLRIWENLKVMERQRREQLKQTIKEAIEEAKKRN